MKRWWISAALAFSLAGFAAAQTAPSDQQSSKPEGTKITDTQTDTIVQPKAKPVAVTPGVIESAQKALIHRGYDAGSADGVMGPRTRAALRKFQADQNLAQTGELDVNTMEKLNVGSTQTLSAAPSDVGRGGKAFGHDIKGGHPVAAGKAMGQGVGTSAKKVGKGVKSAVVGGVDKVGHGLSAIGSKVSNKTEGKDKDKDKNKTPQNPQ
ncbi:MAG TPA: peptidoglycan-binding domain-containing protein [Terriglobales bacterium]|nr:peptidoglycan-binding domain-containing protein [Terriglobales bacterium]